MSIPIFTKITFHKVTDIDKFHQLFFRIVCITRLFNDVTQSSETCVKDAKLLKLAPY